MAFYGCNQWCLPLFIRQEFTVHRDHNAVAFWIFLFCNITCEVDRAHNPIAKLFVDTFFDSAAVDIGYFIKAIDEGVFGD